MLKIEYYYRGTTFEYTVPFEGTEEEREEFVLGVYNAVANKVALRLNLVDGSSVIIGTEALKRGVLTVSGIAPVLTPFDEAVYAFLDRPKPNAPKPDTLISRNFWCRLLGIHPK